MPLLRVAIQKLKLQRVGQMPLPAPLNAPAWIVEHYSRSSEESDAPVGIDKIMPA